MEKPNLFVIKEIAGDDLDFQQNLLNIIKKEFPEETEDFKKNMASKNYKEASNNVHKIKHKISLLGLTKGFEIATNFEKQLKVNETQLHPKFLEILSKIHVYLYN